MAVVENNYHILSSPVAYVIVCVVQFITFTTIPDKKLPCARGGSADAGHKTFKWRCTQEVKEVSLLKK